MSLQEKFEQNYFDGNWLMYGYTCNGRTPKVEKGNCQTVGKQVICKKTLGDDCVTTGHETFRFNLPAQVETGKNIALTYVVGSPRRPNSGHWKNKFQVKDLNLFVSQGRRYVRDPKRDRVIVDEIAPVDPKPQVLPPIVAPKPQVLPPIVAPVEPKPQIIVDPLPPKISTKPYKLPTNNIAYYYRNYFLGNWNAVGYICNKNTPQVEIINIKHIGRSLRLAANKIVGDECIPAGLHTFHFIQPQKIWQGATISVTFQIGAPGTTKRAWKQRTITVIDLNTFKIDDHVYYRQVGTAGKPNGTFINMQPMVGQGSYPGPAYVKINPNSNLRHPVRRFVIVEESINKPGNC